MVERLKRDECVPMCWPDFGREYGLTPEELYEVVDRIVAAAKAALAPLAKEDDIEASPFDRAVAALVTYVAQLALGGLDEDDAGMLDRFAAKAKLAIFNRANAEMMGRCRTG